MSKDTIYTCHSCYKVIDKEKVLSVPFYTDADGKKLEMSFCNNTCVKNKKAYIKKQRKEVHALLDSIQKPFRK